MYYDYSFVIKLALKKLTKINFLKKIDFESLSL